MRCPGLVARQEGGRASFPALKKGLRLMPQGIDNHNPTDVAYTYNGYAPISIRLVWSAKQTTPLPKPTQLLPKVHIAQLGARFRTWALGPQRKPCSVSLGLRLSWQPPHAHSDSGALPAVPPHLQFGRRA